MDHGKFNSPFPSIFLHILFPFFQDDEDIEWKFVRAELYMEFIDPGATLPYPFNILPSPKSIGRLFLKACDSISRTCSRTEKVAEIPLETQEKSSEDDKLDEELRQEIENLATQLTPIPGGKRRYSRAHNVLTSHSSGEEHQEKVENCELHFIEKINKFKKKREIVF